MRKPTFGVQAAYLKKLKEETYIPCVNWDSALKAAEAEMKRQEEDMSIWKIPLDGAPMLWSRVEHNHIHDVE